MTERTCSVEGCGRRHVARGFCDMHYARWRKHGDPLVVLPSPGNKRGRTFCTVDGCGRPSAGRGLCHRHYMRWRTHGDPLKTLRPATTDGAICTVSACGACAVARGYCASHYHPWKKYGDPLVRMMPSALRCAACDAGVQDDPSKPVSLVARMYGVGREPVTRHRVEDHDTDPEWHAKRAAWWIAELAALKGETA